MHLCVCVFVCACVCVIFEELADEAVRSNRPLKQGGVLKMVFVYLFRQHLHCVACAGLKLTAVAKDDLKLLVFLSLPPKCLNYGHRPSCLALKIYIYI